MATNGSSKATEPLDFTKFQNVINGKLVDTKETRHTVNPSTLEELPPVPVATSDDVDQAVEAAKKAQEAWAEVPWAERQKAVLDFAAALEALTGDFAKLLTEEQGKPLGIAHFEVSAAVDWVRTLASYDEPSEIIQDDDKKKIITRYTPLGVAVGIVPWNFPVQIAASKLVAAVVTGNAFIVKPSPFTPYTALKLAELGQRFFPPGVFQALSGGDDLGPLLTAHPGVDKVSFTGSSATGKKVMASCAKTLKRVTLELGGNDPAIVCADVNPAEVAAPIATMALFNSGQVCIAIKRIFIHESVYDEVLKAIVEHVKHLKVGDGKEEGVFLGPINNKQQYERVKGFLEDIEEKGLNVVAGGAKAQQTERKGYFIEPTIIDNPPEDSRIVVEEQFGPVFPALKWTDEEDVIRRANNTDMGLGASVWTKDLQAGERIAKRLKAGNVWINAHAESVPSAPFGGHKQSGIGYEYGIGGLKAYCNAQSLYLKKA